MGRRGESIGRQSGLNVPDCRQPPNTTCDVPRGTHHHPSGLVSQCRFGVGAWARQRSRTGKLSAVLWGVLAGGCASTTAIAVETSGQPITVQVVAQGLTHPWGLAFLPGGRFLVTERGGQLRVVDAHGTVGPPLAGVPRVSAGGQGGLLDVVTDAAFERNRTLYFCFSEPGDGGNSTALARAELAADATQLSNVKVIFSQQPKVASSLHVGCRIAQPAPDLLFLTLGERFSRSDDAQTLDNHLGKVVRIHTDGRVPADNPFVKQAGARPEIWSYGHRNPQGATMAPDGRLWIHEHGPMGGDELNLPTPGANFGWPLASFGLHYNGRAVGKGQPTQPGVTAPVHHWTPSIAPSGMAFVTSNRYGPGWQGNLMVGSLKFAYLARLALDGTRVVREHRLLTERGQRIRDVRQGPDGLLYVLTDAPNGELLRLLPR